MLLVRESVRECFCFAKEKEREIEKKDTYNTRRCLNPAKSALVILVRLFAFKSLHREINYQYMRYDMLIKQSRCFVLKLGANAESEKSEKLRGTILISSRGL